MGRFAWEERGGRRAGVFEVAGGAGAEEFEVGDCGGVLGGELGVREEFLDVGGEEAVFGEEVED